MSQTQHSLSGYCYFGVRYWFSFNRMVSVKPQSHTSRKLWRRKTTFSYSLLVADTFSCTRQELWTLVFYQVMNIRVWFKKFELLSVLLVIKAWFDPAFWAATAQSLCILLWIVPPLYGFFWLTLLILFEEAEWGQFIAWKNITPEEQQL